MASVLVFRLQTSAGSHLAPPSGADYTWAARWRLLIAINLCLGRKPAVLCVMTTRIKTHWLRYNTPVLLPLYFCHWWLNQASKGILRYFWIIVFVCQERVSHCEILIQSQLQFISSVSAVCIVLSIVRFFIFTACPRPGPNHKPSIESWLSTVSYNPPVFKRIQVRSRSRFIILASLSPVIQGRG